MRIWPVVIDSNPAYLGGRRGSLLIAPLGAHTVIEHLRMWLQSVTERAPLVVSPASVDSTYEHRIKALHPSATVVATPQQIVESIAAFELSDTLLIIDPNCLPSRSAELPALLRQYSEDQRVAHHLVAFENAVAGTQERVSFDGSGHVQRIHRHYDSATWPFIAGVAATLVPVASGILSDGAVPTSLLGLRQTLVTRGVPTRDVPLKGRALYLGDESAFLTANELFVRRALARTQTPGISATPLFMGSGHFVHDTARISGPVIIHAGAHVDENAMVFGPAVIGAGARVSSAAVVAHAVVGANCTIPNGDIVPNRAWFDVGSERLSDNYSPFYTHRVARQLTDARMHDEVRTADPSSSLARIHLALKRAFDVTISGIALVLLSPLLLAVVAAVKLGSEGPVLYGDEREGRGGQVFKCWKFRTMCVNAHAVQSSLKVLDKMDGPHFKLDHDPRVTRIGRVLRALNIDELPQLLNVFVGEMSLVGPRPSPFRENQICVPWREARLSVRPGITGFWQVCRHDRSSGDFHQWIEFDLLYVQHMSFWLDLKIVAATLLTLGGKAGHVSAGRLVPSAVPDSETPGSETASRFVA